MLRDGHAENGGSGRELARQLARALPGSQLHDIVGELSAQDARVRAGRYEAALAVARAALDRGDLAAARNQARLALSIDYVRWEAHQALGESFERAGESASALECYVTARHLGWESDDARMAIERVR